MQQIDFQLGQQIAELKGIVVTGFDAITQRQDISNGRLAKHDTIIADLTERISKNEGAGDVKKGTWQALLSVASIIVALLAIIFR